MPSLPDGASSWRAASVRVPQALPRLPREELKAEIASLTRDQLEARLISNIAALNAACDERDTLRLRLYNERLLNKNLLDSMAWDPH